jgi:predicted component of type VI protein secretion system
MVRNYVNANESRPETKAKFPLREAKVEVKEIPGARAPTTLKSGCGPGCRWRS